MSDQTYLVTVTFGPVQGFIAAARRTRDLWFGSRLLSEVSKAGAKGLLDLRNQSKAISVELIFPSVAYPAMLEPDRDLSKDLTVANKIVALIRTEDPGACVAASKEAATKRWENLARYCLAKFGATHVDGDVWNKQVGDMVECYGAWVELEQDYGAAIKRLDVLLNARKATRNFAPAARNGADPLGYGRWKSSLDGARESVLPAKIPDHMRKRFDHVRKRFGIGAGERLEQLDAPGLVKRVLGQAKPFTALARVACDPWIRLVQSNVPDNLLKKLSDCHDRLVRSGLVTRSHARGYETFPYDGQLVYDFRLREIQRKPDTRLFTREAKVLNQLERVLLCIEKKEVPKPDPYVAVLLADGDQMGRFISRKPIAGEHEDIHRNISKTLAGFAAGAPSIIEQHQGVCVYAGGDDVLAFLPAARALGCAEELARRFEKMMATAAQGVSDSERPTLSVGLAFGHIMTPLSTLRARAKDAERAAKQKGIGETDGPHLQPRNALGVVIAPRSGAPLTLRGRWDDTVGEVFTDRPGLAARLDYWAEQFVEALPGRAAYQLRELVRELVLVPEALRYEAQRLVARKDNVGKKTLERIENYLVQRDAKALSEEWIAARWLAEHRSEGTP